MRIRRLAAAAAVCALVAGVAQPAGGQAPAKKILRVALNGFENNLTPFTVSFGASPNSHDLLTLVYDTLYWSQARENPEPWLAESATPSDDRRVWTVTLRSGLTWHDGRPLTAEDVRFTFDYFRDKGAGAGSRYAHHVTDTPPYDRGEVVDARTVRLYFKAPAPAFRNLPASDLPIVPKHVWESVAEPAKETERLPVGSGPFKLVEIVPDQRYRFEANTAYFKGKPMIDELDMPIVRDPSAAFAALRTGQVDFVTRNVPPELVEQFKSTPGVKVVKGTWYESNVLYFNARKPPLTDPKLRKAISLATDSKALVDTVLVGNGRPGNDGFIHPDSPWVMPGARHEHDPARAQRLLDEAGYSAKDPDGVRRTADGRRLEFSILVSSFEPQDIRAAQLLSQQVAPIGVKLNPEALDPAAMRQRRQGPPNQPPPRDAYISTIGVHFHADPDGLYYFFHSPGRRGIGASFSGWTNPKVDELTERSVLMDPQERKPVLHEIQRITAEEAPVIVLWYQDNLSAYRPEAYDGWVTDFGQGVFTKRSFLEEYVKETRAQAASTGAASADDDGDGPGAVIAVAAVVLGLAGIGFLALRQRRNVEAEGE